MDSARNNSEDVSQDFSMSYREEDADYLIFDDENGFVHKVQCVNEKHAVSTEKGLGTPVLGAYVVKEAVLGEGGQGIVLRSSDPFVAVKLAQEGKKDITDPQKITEFKQHMKNLIYLQLPPDLNVSLPYAVLENHAGYVMRLLDTAEPIGKSLMSDSRKPVAYAGDATVSLLSNEHKNLIFSIDDHHRLEIGSKGPENKCSKKPLLYYTVSGGARLRSEALGKTAAILARLHGRGLVYGDISANNVFIAADNDESCIVWLIDADNLEYEKKKGMTVYTPSYGAPELVQRVDGIRFVSDCHAFGVLVSRVMTWVHPFYGKKLEDPNEDSWEDPNSSELTAEEQANAGLLPWIDDPEDRSNAEDHVSKMLPRDVFFTEAIRDIFKYTFCEGRVNPSLRPSMVHWCKALIQERDLTLKCSKCGMSIPYMDNSFKCICCDAEPLAQYVLELRSYRFLPQGRLNKAEWIWRHELYFNSSEQQSAPQSQNGESSALHDKAADDSQSFNLPERIFKPFNVQSFDDPFVRVKYIHGKRVQSDSDGHLSGFFCFSRLSDSDSKVYCAEADRGGVFSLLPPSGRIFDAESLIHGGMSMICMTKMGYARLIAVTLKRC